MPDLATHERELKNTRKEVRNLQVMQMHPSQSAEKRIPPPSTAFQHRFISQSLMRLVVL